MSDAKGPILQELTKHGRTITGVHDISLSEGGGATGGALGTLAAFTGGRLKADRLVVVTAEGPWGPECIVQPVSGHSVLPGEYHLSLPGALRGPVTLRRRLGGTWSAADDKDLVKWVKSLKLDTYLLPDELKQGLTKIKLDSLIQLHPVAPDRSALVFTLGGIHTMVDLKSYLGVAAPLAAAIAASVAPGAVDAIEQPSFSGVVQAALAGELDTHSDTEAAPSTAVPATPSVAAATGVSLSPEQRTAALLAALAPHVGKRVSVAPIDAKALGNITKKVAKETDPGAIIAFLDTGIRASGKAGLAFTSDTVHIGTTGNNWSIAYDEIGSFARRKTKVDLDSQLTGTISIDTYGIEDVIVPALEAATGRSATA